MHQSNNYCNSNGGERCTDCRQEAVTTNELVPATGDHTDAGDTDPDRTPLTSYSTQLVIHRINGFTGLFVSENGQRAAT